MPVSAVGTSSASVDGRKLLDQFRETFAASCKGSKDIFTTLRIPVVQLHDLSPKRKVYPCNAARARFTRPRSEEHTSELQSQSNLVCRLLLEKKKNSADAHIAMVSATISPVRPDQRI